MTRTSIVIGAGRGIGAATVVRLARQGDAVVLVDRAADDPRLPYALASRDDLAAALSAAQAAAPDPMLVSSAVADATDEDALRTLVEDTEAMHGGVDAIVVTAGVIAGGVPLWEMPRAEVDAVMEVDILAVLAAARAGIPALLRRDPPRSGRFVAIASSAASRGLPMLSAYSAAKSGVTGLVRGLAVELRNTGITANAVSPGSTDTPMLRESARLYGLADLDAFAHHQAIGRLIEPDEIAAVVAWLAGPNAGAVTGGDHAVDGGLSV